MNGTGQSDRFVVPANPPDKAAAAEAGEERQRTKGNTAGETRPGRSAGQGVSSELGRVREVAQKDRNARFTALLRHVSLERLVMAYWDLSPEAAPGVDGVTWDACGQDLVANLRDLHARVQQGRYPGEPISAGIHPEGGRAAAAARHCHAGGQDHPAHYVLDLRADWWRHRFAHGDVIIIRFADDFIVGFEYRQDAERFRDELGGRFARFGLELHPGKTRLVEFGRRAARDRVARGEGKPETFTFLGFTHICATSKNGRFWIRRKTDSKRARAKLAEVKAEIRRRRCLPIPDQGRWLAAVVGGHQAYYPVPGNSDAVNAFRTQVIRHWLKALRRRSHKGRGLTWARMNRVAARWIPPTRTVHPFPQARFAAMHPR